MNAKKLLLNLFLICILLSNRCAEKFHTFEKQLLFHADSLFNSGEFESSKQEYAKILNSKPHPSVARKAQYYLGYINVCYDNPSASWEAALKEFKTFAELYPDDFRIQEVNSWIRILLSMQTFEKAVDGTSLRLDEAIKKRNTDSNISEKNKQSIASYSELLKKCTIRSDSLSRKNRELENVIRELEMSIKDIQ